MNEKRKGRSLNAIYCKPLPVSLSVDLYGRLPATTLTNPLSWVWMLYHMGRMYFRTPAHLLDRKYPVSVVTTSPDVVFQVQGDDMMELWKQGFFGKGTLSRSDPTWKQRAQNRQDLQKEDLTKTRRGDRKTFKQIRAQVQNLEAVQRQRALTAAEESDLRQLEEKLELIKRGGREKEEKEGEEKEGEEKQKRTIEGTETGIESKNEENGAEKKAGEKEGEADVKDAAQKREPEKVWQNDGRMATDQTHEDGEEELERLQLQKVELFFLAYALDAVEVQQQKVLSLNDTLRLCMAQNMAPDNQFLLEYVVYHHFRSLGWCVKSGIKFGCHFLLYKRGPPFLHAEHAILVVPNGRAWTTWEDFMGIARVVSAVKKNLVLAYVDVPDADFQQHFDKDAITRLLQQYRVTEVVYRRWSPSRTRD